MSRRLDRRHEPTLLTFSLVDRPASTDPTIRGAVVWGLVGARVRSTTLRSAGRVRTPARSAQHGAFIELFGPSKSTMGVSAVVHYDDGHVTDTSRRRDDGFIPRGYRPAKHDAIVDGSQQLIARAADPASTQSWGVLGERTKKGLWCVVQSGRLIGDRVGQLQSADGILLEPQTGSETNGCGSRAQPTKRFPLQLMWGGGGYDDATGRPTDPARGALRLQPGRIVVSGRALDTVDRFTVATSADVRTIVPTDPGHGFIIVYAGEDVGTAHIRVHFTDGHVQTMTINLGTF